MRYLFSLLLMASVSGCAGFEIYSDAGMQTKTGIPFYTQKPHLLVSRTGAKDKPIDIKVVYITDHSDAYYVKTKSGFGSNKLTLGLTNGMLTSVGQETDPKLAELITSLTGVPTAFAGADKLGAEAIKLIAEANALEEQSSDGAEFIQALEDITSDLEGLPSAAGFAGAFNTNSQRKIRLSTAALREIADELKADPRKAQSQINEIISRLESELKVLKGITKSDDLPDNGPEALVWSRFDGLRTSLSNTISEAKPKPAPQPELSLYRIQISGGTTTLVEVPIPSSD